MDGIYTFQLGACDAAYSPESHGRGEGVNELWEIAGNCDDSLAVDSFKIDTRPPMIDLSMIEKVYAAKDLIEGALSDTIIVTDELSGIDINSLDISIQTISDPPEPLKVVWSANEIESDFEVIFRITELRNTDATLKVLVQDIAGNSSSDSLEFQIKINPPVLTEFRPADLNADSSFCFAPADGYTDSLVIFIDNFSFVEETEAAFLDITVDVNNVGSGNVVKKYNPNGIILDVAEVVNASIPSGSRIQVTINAMDAYENTQTNGPTRSILYDTTPPTLSNLAVNDPEPFPQDSVNGAFGAYTNDETVRITLESPDNDLYALQQLQPQEVCYDSIMHSIDYTFADLSEGDKTFTLQIADFAGNGSNQLSKVITLDRSIDQPDSSHFTIADSPDGQDLVDITYENSEDVIINDVSRFIVNNMLYITHGNIATVPANADGYTIVLVDSAGNQNDPVYKTPPFPQFTFTLKDTSDYPFQAQAGYTNEPNVEWDVIEANFLIAKLVKMIFWDSTKTRSVEKEPDDRFTSLEELYPDLTSGRNYKVYAQAVVRNWPPQPQSHWPSFTLYYDAEKPVLNSIALSADGEQAAEGFTDRLEVHLFLNTESDSVDSVAVSGAELIKVNGEWQSLPDTLAYASEFELQFADTQQDTATLRDTCSIRNKTGSWSDFLYASLFYLKQELLVMIDTADTVTISEFDLDENSRIYLPVQVQVDYPQYVWKILTGDQNMTDTIETLVADLECGLSGDTWSCPEIPFKIDGSSSRYVVAVDSAGNISNQDSVYIDFKESPQISLTLYDYSEFPEFTSPTALLPEDWQRSDSLFTDESTGLLAAVTRLTKGDWDSIRFAPRDAELLNEKAFTLVAEADSNIHLCKINIPEDVVPLETLTFYVEVKNTAGLSDTTSTSIIYDSQAPELTVFKNNDVAAERNVVSQTAFSYNQNGTDESPGEPAGLIVAEIMLGGRPDTTYHFVPNDAMDEITLSAARGMRKLVAYMVDKADIDQNRPDSLQARLSRKDFSSIDHPSNRREFEIRLNPAELSNFPNPFNPKSTTGDNVTYLMFHLSADSDVDITILDAFGNRVKQWGTRGYAGLNSGGNGGQEKLQWDGTNENNQVVANGGYICIIKALDTGETYMRKIAVVKTD